MKVNQAKEYYDLGLVTGFDAVKMPERGWSLIVYGPSERSWMLETALGKEKVYSTFEAVNLEINRITGFIPPVWSFKI